MSAQRLRALFAWLVLVAGTGVAEAREEKIPDNATFGGPSSTPAQISSNDETKRGVVLFEELSRAMQPYYDVKERLEKEYGLGIGGDYQVLYQHATESPGKKDASSGVFRLYGHWTPGKGEMANPGSLVFKVEQRHRIASIPPQALGPTVGYAGLTAVTFSDAGGLLTNLYWTQAFAANRFAFSAGIVDVTDYLDVYGLVNIWTDFNNYAFTTSPTIPAPNQGLGAAARWMFTPNTYVLGGVADANADPHRPEDFFSTLNDGELFKHLELGWIGSWEKRYSDNFHVTAWQVDAREKAGVDSGWGGTVSFSKQFGDRWLPFFRAGYSDGGGALIKRIVSTGVGYALSGRHDYIGVGASWARAPAGPGSDPNRDQYTIEAYYRLQLLKGLQLTPDVQYIRNPANNPLVDSLWVVGLRLRAAF